MTSISPEHWQIFAGLVAIIILLGGAVVALRRLGFLPVRPPPPAAND